MDLSNFLSTFGQTFGLRSTSLDNGVCRLVFNETISVNIEEGVRPGTALVYASVGELPADTEARKARCEEALMANAYGAKTGGAALSLKADQKILALSTTLYFAQLDADGFADYLNSFVHQVAKWRQHLKWTEVAA